MDSKKSGAKNALKVAQSGTPVPEKDFSSKKKEVAAATGSAKGSMAVAKSLPTEKFNSAPVASDPKPTEVKKTWEGSPEDWGKDYSASKRKGISTADYEDSAHDRIADAAGERNMAAKEDASKSVDDAPGYKRGVSAFSNNPKASHGFGHPSSAKDGHLRNSGHSGAHRIGKKK